MENKNIFTGIGIALVLIAGGIIAMNVSGQSYFSIVPDGSTPLCTEFLTNAVNGQYISGTYVAVDYDNDKILEYFGYSSTATVSICTSSSTRFLTKTAEDYNVYLKSSTIYICFPSILANQFYNIQYGKRNSKNDTPCIICNNDDSKCVGFIPTLCVNNNWKGMNKTIGQCDVECLKQGDCGYYMCEDNKCTNLIQNDSILREMLDQKMEDISNLKISLEDKINLINSMDISLSEKTVLIDSLEASLQDKINLINSMDISLGEKNQIISGLTSKVTSLEDAIKQKNELIEQYIQAMKSSSLSLEEKVALINGLTAQIDELNTGLSSLTGEVSSLTLTLEDKAKIISSLNLDISEKNKFVDQLQLTLDDKTKLISELGTTIAEKQRMIEELEKNKKNKNYALAGVLGVFGFTFIGVGMSKKKENY